MGGGTNAECWVTLAESDLEAWRALVLGRSIRKTLSSRPVIVTISENVSQPLKVLLQREFDCVIRFDSSEVGGKGSGILWLWNLRYWRKCVFIDANCYMLKNSDDLFSKPNNSAVIGTAECVYPLDIVVLEPDLKVFDKLRELGLQNLADIRSALTSRCISINEHLKGQIVSCFASTINPARTKPGTTLDVNDARQCDNGLQDDAEALQHKWVSTFVHEVVPMIGNITNKSAQLLLLSSLEQHHLPTVNGPVKTDTLTMSDVGDLHNAIAVVGMSCRFPGANNEQEFWNLLTSATDPIQQFPTNRPILQDVNSYIDNNLFEAGFLKCPIDEFDAKFFNISPREAPFVDPQQRLLLEVIWESLENANINPITLRETKTGVFVGIWQQEYDRHLPDLGLSANEFHHRYLGNAFSATASRISHFLGLYGPNYAIESGCSSGSSAVHLAVQSLRREESKVAIASGVNLVLHLINPMAGGEMESVVLSNNYRCKTFDESADGFVRAEGCGSVVLKPLTKAIRDGDTIQGIIRGTALNNDGPATSFGTPNATAQELVYRDALADAGILPADVSLVEAHGTGTVVGDPIETYAIGQVYSAGRSSPLLLTSVKSNIGHTEACAGMAGLIKVLLCLKNKQVPPQLHFKNLNPRINVASIPAIIPTEVTEWNVETRIAAVSSFSMSGTNVHLIVQETPENLKPLKNVEDSCHCQMVGISAKTEEALEELCQRYADHFNANPQIKLGDVALTLDTGRANMSHRIGIVAKDTNQLIGKLEKKNYVIGRCSTQKTKIVFLFTGQGSQYFGMGKSLYANFAVFRVAFKRCDALFSKHLNLSLKEVLWTDTSLLDKTMYCQPVIFAVQFCIVELWASFGIKPDFVLGHSVGEFCAAVCAGVLSLEDGMKLVVGRSKLVDSLSGGKMMAVKTSAIETRRLIKEFSQCATNGWVDIAAENSLEETVVSGIEDNVQNFANFCASRGFKMQMINATHAFHSRAMDLVANQLGKFVPTSGDKLRCAYISGTLAREMKVEEFDPTYWVRHLRDTVRFEEAVKCVWEASSGCRVLVEIGAQPILLGLAMANIAESSVGTFCPSMRKSEDDLLCVMNSLSKMYVAGVEICWDKWFKTETKLVLPTYPFQRQKYWFHNEHEAMPISPLVHPLVGRQLQTPMSDTAFSQLLSTKDLPYISDHRVADLVILPASAYLETILAAGCHVLQGGRVEVPFTVENFIVDAALVLSKPCQIQTIVRSIGGEEGVKFEIAIHKQLSCDEWDKWKRHAVASFSPSLHTSTTSIFDIAETKQNMEPVQSISQAYEAIAKAGIQFGPKFQSIERAWKTELSLLTELHLPSGSASYICHPIVLDAMIQTFAFRTALTSKDAEQIKLQLPVSIQKIVWLAKTMSEKLYVYTTWLENESGLETISLLNDSGETVAKMEGIQLIVTTVPNFLRILKTESNTLPDFMEELWRPTSGITRNRIDPMGFDMKPGKLIEQALQNVAEINDATLKMHTMMNELFTLSLLRGIKESQWPWPNVGDTLEVGDWTSIAGQYLHITKTDALMNIIEEYGYLRRRTQRVFEVVKDIDLDSTEKSIVERLQNLREIFSENAEYQFAARCERLCTSVLQGKISPIAYLFPEDANEVGATRVYSEAHGNKDVSVLVTSLLLDYVTSNHSSGTVRILEAGAGSGVCCDMILSALAQLNITCNYSFTDISQHFLLEARKKFTKGVTFGIFNIEEDPLAQGYASEQFDIVLAVNVVHATRTISESLENLNVVLRPNGILLLGEMFKPITFVSLSFGFLDGWWRFEGDRNGSPLLNRQQWVNAFEQGGFGDIGAISIFDDHFGAVTGRKVKTVTRHWHCKPKSWLQVSDGSRIPKRISEELIKVGRLTHEVTDILQEVPLDIEGAMIMCTEISHPLQENQSACENFLYVCKRLIETFQDNPVKPHLVLITRGVNYIGDAGPGNPNVASTTSLLRSFVNEHSDFPVSAIDLDQDNVNDERELTELFASIWSKDKELFKAIREDKVYVQRLVYSGKRKAPVAFPNSNRFQITNPSTKSLNDLQISVAPKVVPVGKEVEVAIRATALNFRDLFLILRPDGFDIPLDENTNPGLDIAGVVSAIGPECTKFQIGDAVVGFIQGGGLASHVVVSSELLLRKPLGITFTLAATLPVPSITVLYSFKECAILQGGDRVLIHVATGGVGLAAIQYAKHVGAEIYATAGSRRKRAYLKSIGIKYVYHSRNTRFGEEILEDTQGRGVDVVLNSLTAPNFKEASLKACAQGARFVEIGKMNIWTEGEVKELRPDVKYFIVELSITVKEQPEKINDLVEPLTVCVEKNVFKGLPHDSFPLSFIRDAFFYFQEAKHIGKIVITIPEVKVLPQGGITFQQNLFQPESTYMITGGLGGIGMELAKWMSTTGAHNIVLIGRSLPSSKCEEIIRNINGSGARVVAVQADVGVFKDCEKVLKTIEDSGFPPLRGIMHAAGVLSDATVANQSWEKFQTVFHSKISGTWNLHNLTVNCDMEFFTLFSSLASQVGTPGQSNHAAANRFMDSFIHYRHSIGLPGNSINFGPWADVGAAANLKIAQDGMFGVRLFSPNNGILSLQQILQTHLVQASVADVSDWNIVKQIVRLGPYLSEMKTENSSKINISEEFKAIVEEIKNAHNDQRQSKIEDLLEKVIKDTLRIPDNEQIDRDQNFSEIGVDSLMAMELRNRLQCVLGEKQLTVAALQENRTIRSLSAHMADLLNGEVAVPLENLLAQDVQLPPEILATSKPPLKPSQFKEILLTGANGHLGVNMLPSLQRENPTLIVHCIVRAADDAEAERRLVESINIYSLSEKVNLSNIRAWAGDICKPNIGLSSEIYEALADSVDAVVHCAIKSNHLEEYNSMAVNSLRYTNVTGTVNVLKFAANRKTKAILYASSMLAVTTASEDGTLVEDFPAEGDLGRDIKMGYVLSKFVCEKLLAQATQRGIPVTVIRYASIVGNSTTGFMPTENNHTWRILLSCIRVRAFPQFDQNGIPWMSVDSAADISARIFLRDTSELGMYNLTSSSVTSEADIVEAFAKFGVEAHFLPYTAWRDLVFERFDENDLAPFISFYGEHDNTKTQNYIAMHPLATKISSLRMNSISEKVKRNFAEVEQHVIPGKVILEKHLQFYYDQLTTQG